VIDDDYVIGELCRSHLQAELFLHGGIKTWWGIGAIGWRGHDRAGASELSELGFVWIVPYAGLIDCGWIQCYPA
jgi:hypothetical protein